MPEALCFDMYGTLCDTSSVTARLGEALDAPGVLTDVIDETWRRTQLAYSFQLSVMGDYEPFWTVTRRALDYALAQYGLDPDDETRARILGAYEHLDPFPGAVETLSRLRDEGYTVAVLSNGNPEMLDRLAENAGLASHLDDVVSADEVGTFKPSPAVYENAASRLDCDLGDCALVSGNSWDVAGAGAAGMGTAWVNRRRDPFEEIGARPDREVTSLVELPDAL
ncbi:MAG: haloacid dehalogenase type II [Haloferacaceae archaeon]